MLDFVGGFCCFHWDDWILMTGLDSNHWDNWIGFQSLRWLEIDMGFCERLLLHWLWWFMWFLCFIVFVLYITLTDLHIISVSFLIPKRKYPTPQLKGEKVYLDHRLQKFHSIISCLQSRVACSRAATDHGDKRQLKQPEGGRDDVFSILYIVSGVLH